MNSKIIVGLYSLFILVATILLVPILGFTLFFKFFGISTIGVLLIFAVIVIISFFVGLRITITLKKTRDSLLTALIVSFLAAIIANFILNQGRAADIFSVSQYTLILIVPTVLGAYLAGSKK